MEACNQRVDYKKREQTLNRFMNTKSIGLEEKHECPRDDEKKDDIKEMKIQRNNNQTRDKNDGI